MSAIVVNVDSSGKGKVALSVDAPFELDEEFDPHFTAVTSLKLGNIEGPNLVRQLGEGLVAKLKVNRTVGKVLETALMQKDAPPSQPIYFRIGDSTAHALSWEALYGGRGFLALDPRWPIARLPRGGRTVDTTVLTFGQQLHLVCVLSAIGVEALPEWNGIYEAVKAVRKTLDIRVTLLAGEQAVIEAAKEIDDPNLTVLPVPPASDRVPLIDRIRDMQPHILHMFCHGRVAGDVNIFDVATISDFEADEGKSSVTIRAQELGEALKNSQVWCVVLNTCKGADASGAAFTHAEKMVNAGVPVAIGMRRQIDVKDAYAFSAAFYPPVFDTAATLRNAAGPREISWADTLLGARRKLRDVHGAVPDDDDSWTIPVLYTRRGPFTVNVVAPGTVDQEIQRASENVVVDQFIDIMGANAPTDVIEALRAQSGD